MNKLSSPMLYLIGSVLFTTGLVTQVVLLSLLGGFSFIFGSFMWVLQTVMYKPESHKGGKKHYLTDEQFCMLRDTGKLRPDIVYIIIDDETGS